MELKDGKVRVQASYGLKVSTGAAYSSHDRTAGISIEYSLPDGVELQAVIDAALQVESRLDTDLKLAVATALGIGTKEVDGTLLPNVPAAPEAPKSSGSSGGYRKSSGGGGGGKFKDKTFEFDFDGETFEVKDQRQLKRSGKFSESSPDFKLVSGEINGRDAFWLKTKSGGTDKIAAAMRLAAPPEPEDE